MRGGLNSRSSGNRRDILRDIGYAELISSQEKLLRTLLLVYACAQEVRRVLRQ